MIETLRNHLIARLGKDINNLDKVLSLFQPVTTKRNQQLLKEGDVCKYVYFIAKGSLQVFVYDADFNEKTRDIVVENNWCSELVSFGSGTPSTENISTIEPADLLRISHQDFQTLVKTVPQFDRVYKQILEASYANSVYRINSFVSLSAVDRIKWLMDFRPRLMTRFFQQVNCFLPGHIAGNLQQAKSQNIKTGFGKFGDIINLMVSLIGRTKWKMQLLFRRSLAGFLENWKVQVSNILVIIYLMG